MKTLEQVREHFKGAETIYCLANGKEFNTKNADVRGIHYDLNSYWLVDAKTGCSYLMCNLLGHFAGIKKTIFKAGELEFMADGKWFDTIGEYRLKPNNTAEIEALEKQKLEIEKQINKLK